MSITENVLDKIKKEHIEPTPKWRFLLKEYAIWTFFVLAVIIGSLSFSVMLFVLNSNDWDIYKYLDKSLLEYIILSLPYLWFVVLALFIIVAAYNFKHTKKGYKYHAYIIIIASVILSLIIGATLSAAGLGEKIDQVFSSKLPYYQKMMPPGIHFWANPPRGLLAGIITEIINDSEFTLKDIDGKEWKIINLSGIKIEAGKMIKMIGKKINENTFEAREIRPGKMPGGNKMMPPKMMRNINPAQIKPNCDFAPCPI